MHRSTHVAVPVRGRRVCGPPLGNARNVRDCTKSAPLYHRVLYDNDERSIHAESRVAARVGCRRDAHNRGARRQAAAMSRHYSRRANGVVVTRFSATGRIGNSQPCAHCVAALQRAGFSFVVYSDAAGAWHKESLTALQQRAVPSTTVRTADERRK